MIEKAKEKTVNFRPIVAAAVAFASGILCSFLCFLYGAAVIAAVSAAFAVGFILLFLFKAGKNFKTGAGLLLLVFVFGLSFAEVRITAAENARSFSGSGLFCGTVESCKKLEKSGYSVVFKHMSFNGEQLSGSAKGYVYSSADIDAGDRLTFAAELKRTVDDYYDKKDDFSRSSLYEAFRGRYYAVKMRGEVKGVSRDDNIFERTFLSFRDVFVNNLGENSYPLAIALVLGDTSYLDYSVKEIYRTAGIAHVFAVSGLHIGLFVTVFAFIAAKLGLKRWKKLAFVLVPAFIYCGVCGFRPSAVRAFIMTGMLILSEFVGFKRDRLSVLALAFIVILLWQPFYLFDAGFQLSFLAVGGIICYSPVISRGAKPLKRLGEGVSVTMSATLGTLPVLTDISGYMSIISVFTNLIFVPIICVVYQISVCFAFFAVVENAVFGSATVSLFIPDVLIGAVNFAVGLFDYSKVIVPAGFGILAVPYYFGLLFLTDYVNVSSKYKLPLVLFFSGFALIASVL